MWTENRGLYFTYFLKNINRTTIPSSISYQWNRQAHAHMDREYKSAIHKWETNQINFQLYQTPPTIIDNHSGPLLWTKSEKFLSVGFFQILSVEGAEGYLGDLAMDYCTTVTASAAHQTHRIKRKQVKDSFVGFSVGYLVYLKFISTLKWTRQNDFHIKQI